MNPEKFPRSLPEPVLSGVPRRRASLFLDLLRILMAPSSAHMAQCALSGEKVPGNFSLTLLRANLLPLPAAARAGPLFPTQLVDLRGYQEILEVGQRAPSPPPLHPPALGGGGSSRGHTDADVSATRTSRKGHRRSTVQVSRPAFYAIRSTSTLRKDCLIEANQSFRLTEQVLRRRLKIRKK